MAERETKEIVTPLGHTVVIKTYLTGREADEITRKVFEGKETAMDKPTMSATAGLDKLTMTLQAALVSIDGVTDGAFDILNDLPVSERNFVNAEFNKLAKGNF